MTVNPPFVSPLRFITGPISGIANAVLMGLIPDTPAGAPPPPPWVAGLIYARREVQYTFFNQAPRVIPTFTHVGLTGVITGSLGATAPNGSPLTYTVLTAPKNGTVTLDAAGGFVYTPTVSPTAARSDTFTLSASDGPANQLPGLLGFGQALAHFGTQLVGLSQPDASTVTFEVRNPSVTTIATGSISKLANSPDGHFVYALNPLAGTVSVIDTATNQVIRTIPNITGGPQGLAVTPDGTALYVPTYTQGTTVLDIASGTTSTIPGTNFASNAAISPDGRLAYVPEIESGHVAVIDTATQTVIKTVSLGGTLYGVAVSPTGDRVYVSSVQDGKLYTIRTADDSVTALDTGFGTGELAISPDGRFVYARSLGPDRNGQLVKVDTVTNTVVATTDTGPGIADDVAISPDGRYVYLATPSRYAVVVVDTTTNAVVTTIPTGHPAYAARLSPDGRTLYIGTGERDNPSNGAVYAIAE